MRQSRAVWFEPHAFFLLPSWRLAMKKRGFFSQHCVGFQQNDEAVRKKMSSRQVFGRWNGFFSGVQLSMKLVETGFSNRSNSTFWPKENKDAVTEEENQRCNASGHSTGRGAKKDRFRKSRHQNNSYCYG